MFDVNFENIINFNENGWKLTSVPEIEYRSHIRRMECNCPNRWVSATANNKNGQTAKIWWYMDNPNEEDGTNWVNDWNKCADIEQDEF